MMTMSRALLADYERNAGNAERERIIKLLEVTYDSKHFVGLNMHEVIALIKGENK
jgi:hypothetical protein